MKHTRTPWFLATGCSTTINIDDAKGLAGARNYYLATVTHGDPDELQANAEFIVRACNSHDALVAALKAMCDHYGFKNPALQNDAEKVARAALAAAGAS